MTATPTDGNLQLQLNNTGSWKTIAWFPRKAKRERRIKNMAITLNQLGANAHFRIVDAEGSILSEYRRNSDGWRDL